MIKKQCLECKVDFFTYKSRIKAGKGRFCSKKCWDTSQEGKKPWNTGKKCPQLSASKMGAKNPAWMGGISKKQCDSRYAQTPRGREGHRKANKKYNEANREKLNEKRKEKLKKDVHFKLKRNISNQIWCRLVRQRFSKKDAAVLKCLPYTIQELKKHLEELFLPGMSWENYGKWHIDHVVPDSFFFYQTTRDIGFKKSWELKNLQPLWALDNIKKGGAKNGKVIHLKETKKNGVNNM